MYLLRTFTVNCYLRKNIFTTFLYFVLLVQWSSHQVSIEFFVVGSCEQASQTQNQSDAHVFLK